MTRRNWLKGGLVAALFALAGPVLATEVEEEVAQCRKECFRNTCAPAFRTCTSDPGKNRTVCERTRKSCEDKCIKVECAT